MAVLVGLSACRPGNRDTDSALKSGVYTLKDAAGELPPFIQLGDDGVGIFAYSMITSYLPIGTYQRSGDTLYLRIDTQGEPVIQYAFTIADGELMFIQDQSAPLPDFVAEDIPDGTVFVYTTAEPYIH